MNLSSLEIPPAFEGMQHAFQTHYSEFYLEMVHISNKNLVNAIEKYVQMVTTLSRGPSIENLMRAAIGVTALHQFGYNDFTKLTGIFDRLIPQNDLEYVRFTSWCAGRLVHHPSFEQSRYVAHLLERLLGWVRAYGRRSRHLAAVCLLEYLSLNAGSEVVVFFEQWQSAVWTLVSHPSMQLIRATASAVNMLTRAILRYRRSDLDAYLSFFTQLIYRLLSFGSPFKVYAALKILEQLISSCPDFFSSKFGELYDMISDATYDGPLLVQAESYVSISHLTYVDPKQFSDLYADSLLEKTDEILLEFPRCIGASLSRMINNIPEYMETKIPDIKQYAIKLVNDPDWSFDLLTAATIKFGEKFLPIDEELIMKLMKSPMTKYFNNFFIAYTRAIGEKINPKITEALAAKIIDEFSTSETILALDLIAGLPGFALKQNGTLMKLISEKSMFEADEIRKAIPAALYSLAKSTNQPEYIRETTEKLFQFALFDPSTDVRLSILRALKRDAIKELADPEAVKFLQLFANDDSTSVRNLVFQTIAALGDINPMYVSNITRHALLEHFYSIKNVPGIRLRSRVIKTLPDLITATGATMKIYAKPFMEIAMDILMHPPEKSTLENFLEQEAVTNIEIGLFDSISLIAPIAPTIIAEDSYHLIPFLCNKLHTSEDRALLLSDLHLLFVLSSPPAAVVQYRIMAPLILSACSKLLANTQSRKVRMAILRVIGSLGVLDVHQRSPPMGSQAPTNLDDKLTRSFFTPSRDLDNPIDDTLLLKPETCEQCYVNVVATALLKILNNDELSELYGDTVTSLCDVLKNPRMFMLTYFDQFFNRFLVILDTANESDMQLYLPILSKLIVQSSHNSTPFTERVLNFVVSHYNDNLGVLYLDVIIALVTTLRDGFAPYATTAISLLVSCLEAMKSQNEEVCDRVFKAFSQTGIYAVDLLYLIVPQICDVIVSEQALMGVRKLAIQSLKRIAQDAELILYLGPIVRAINYALGCKCTGIKDDVFDLIFTLLKTQGRPFVKNAMPLINYIRRTGSANSEFEQAIESAQQIENFTPTITATPPILRRKKAAEHPFSEDTLIARAITPTLGYGRHLEQWLHSFMIVCINSSPNEDIRCCTTLATNYQPLAMMLFKIAFFSCWKKLSQQGKSVITNTFHSLLIATENYEVVTNEIMDLIFFMSKFEDMKIPLKHLVSSALRYGSNAFALCIQQDAIQRGVIKKKMAKMLIDTFINLGEWNNAIAVWKQYSSMIPSANKEDFLSKLHMWDVALPIYEQKYKQTKNPNSFNGYIKSLSNLGQWPTVVENVNNFDNLNLTAKRDVTSYFANAAFLLEKWDDLKQILESRSVDSIRCMVLLCLYKIKSGDYNIDSIITNAWSLLASRPITFWANNQQIHRDTMLRAQQIVEVLEIRDWAKYPNKRQDIERVWNQRLQTSPRDFEVWFPIISNRFRITHKADQTFLDLFSLKSLTLGTKLNSRVFNIIFRDLDLEKSPDLDRVCYVLNNYNTGNKEEALKQMKMLTQTVKGELLSKCHDLYATWLLEKNESIDTLYEAYSHLEQIPVVNSHAIEACKGCHPHNQIDKQFKEKMKMHDLHATLGGLYLPTGIVKALEIDLNGLQILRKWSDINSELINRDPAHLTKYVTNAIDALAKCCSISASFIEIVQLLNLFFEHANHGEVFDQTSWCISQISADLLLQASPQLLVQLNHPSPKVAQFVHHLLYNLLDEHYHALIFSLIVNTFSKDASRAHASTVLYNEFKQAHPVEAEEVSLIRKCLLRAAVTWYEYVLQKINDAIDHFSLGRVDLMQSTLQSIIQMTNKPRCEMHQQFVRQYGSQLRSLDSLMKVFSPRNQNCMNSISSWCRIMQDSLTEDIKKVRVIQLRALSEQLDERTHFKLAVPGTYRPGRQINRIQYFVGQFSVYMSKQQPKDVIVRGEDGNFYQYLVKGHEDLRLDERIMQFFRLINSFLKKQTYFSGNLIGTMGVIPLSMQHGLVQWVRGTDTLRHVVETYRKLYGRDPMQEFKLLEEYSYSSFDYMQPIQKQQVLEKVMRNVPSNDIAKLFILKADSTSTWLKQQHTFAISTAMTSIVGYVIGLGDRHPSNILIDRLSGKVIHIDFGDCFEKAAKRKFLPEVVPFRLTRMMVSAMGVTGTMGTFRTAFVQMANILRENRRVLVMVLSIFVHEPLVDPDSIEDSNIDTVDMSESVPPDPPQQAIAKERMQVNNNLMLAGSIMEKSRIMLANNPGAQSSLEMRHRVNQKLCGTDFDNKTPLSVEEQAGLLISNSVSTYNLAMMYSGWCSFW